MARRYPDNLPSRYARDKLATLRTWWGGQPGEVMRRMVPVVWPGIPVEAHFGFISNATWNEDTATTPDHAPFHELGAYGTEGGRWDLPAPNTDTRESNTWLDLHADPEVRSLLGGRDASMADWHPVEDQVAIGAVNLKRKLLAANGALDRRIRAAAPYDSLWAVALSFAAWSAGPGGIARHVNHYAADLAGEPESRRWQAFLTDLAQDSRSGAASPGMGHDHAVYTAIRTQQKLAAGKALAAVVGSRAGWFGDVPESILDPIARAAGGSSGLGAPITDIILGTSRKEDGSEHGTPGALDGITGLHVVLIAGGAGLVAATAAYFLSRNSNQRRRR